MPKELTPLQRRNRELYPEFAAFVDEMREVFGDIKIKGFHPYTPEEAEAKRAEIAAIDSKAVPGLEVAKPMPVACQATNAKDKRSLNKQRELEAMVASGQIELGGS